MLPNNLFFGNLFNTRLITAPRLYAFGIMVLNALQLANANGIFTAIIALLTAALDALDNELADVDTNLNQQKTETRTVDQFIYDFYTYMSASEPFIKKSLGGGDSVGYQAFYPNKQSEYTKATKTTMPKLTQRVARAAKKYSDVLDADMAAKLQSFSPDFKAQYATQQAQIRTVEKDRAERTTAFTQLQLVLMQTMFTVGAAFPGDISKCSTFFPFATLYPQGKKHTCTSAGLATAGTVVNVLAQILTKHVTITPGNMGKLANYAFWLAASPTDAMPKDALIITVGSVPPTLVVGDLPGFETNAYYMIKNLSDTDDCEYEITFSGGRQKIGNTALAAGAKLLTA